MKKKQRAIMPVILAIIVGLITVFISKSNDEPSDCALWKVKIENSIFYLAGSIHVAKEESYPLGKAYTKAYKKADKVVFELEDDFETLEKKIFEYAEKDKLPSDTTLSKFLSPENLELVKKVLDEDMFQKVDRYEAWLMNMTLAGYKMKLVGYDPELAIDKYFYDQAARDGKKIIGLDALENQLALFDFEVPFEQQIDFLKNSIDKMEELAIAEEPLYNAYFENNMKSFEESFVAQYDFSNPQMKAVYNMIFTNRNKLWVGKLEELAKSEPGNYFVLVGAGHYFGENNIRVLLEEKGYIVEKI